MGQAAKCDFCGDLFEYYNTKSSEKDYNSIMFCNIDNYRRSFQHNIHDICPECKEKLDKFLGSLPLKNE